MENSLVSQSISAQRRRSAQADVVRFHKKDQESSNSYQEDMLVNS